MNGSALVRHFNLPGKIRGREWITKVCPECGTRSRGDAVAINLDTGRWCCHAHGCKGDGFALIASLSGLDSGRDFVEVVKLAAEILGVERGGLPMSASERAALAANRARRDAEQQQRERAEEHARREAAIGIATPRWESLDRRSAVGEAYLLERGLDPAILVERDLVRFEPSGNIAVRLHAGGGEVVNVVRRRLTGDPKVLGLKDCPTAGTLLGKLADIAGAVDVVVVEGVADSLTAALAYPAGVVLGAHGASQLAKVAEQAARRVKLAGGRMLLGVHADDAGERAALAAARAARAVGLRLHHELVLIEHHEKDLNDAWRTGWRPNR